MWAWTQNNQVRDVCHGDPTLCYHPDIAQLYNTEVPDGTENGATFAEGAWMNPPPPPEPAPYVPPAPTVDDFDAALTAHLDATAQARRYDNRITCALRAGYTGPFQAEGQAFATWMDACNWQAYQVLAGVQSGALTMPTVEEFVADLPDMVWPT